MADWAGAVAAMRARFVGAFNAAPVKYQNEDPPQSPWPPAGPWIYFEVIQTQSSRTTRLGFRQGQATKLPICLSSFRQSSNWLSVNKSRIMSPGQVLLAAFALACPLLIAPGISTSKGDG